MRSRLGLAVPLLIVAACEKPKPPVPVVELRPTGDTVVVTFTEPPAAVWLGGNRWAVLGSNERYVALVQTDSGKQVRLGGAKSDSYKNPFALFRSGDSLWVDDWAMGRATAWTLGGTMAGSVPSAAGLHGALPRGRDAAGQFYFEVLPPSRPDGSGNRDSSAIVRATPDLSRFDTIARLSPFDLAQVQEAGGARYERRALSGTDGWGVLPDGTLWLARVFQNRVWWIAPSGSKIRGEALPDPVLPVQDEDREMFYRQFPEELRASAEKVNFAVVKPPFVRAMAAPDGNIWLEKSRAYGDSLRQWQEIDRTGTLVRVFRARTDGSLIGLAPGIALLAEPFPNGHRLLTFRIPQ